MISAVFEIPEKNMEQLYSLYDKLAQHGIEKDTFEVFCGKLLISGQIELSKELVATRWYTK